MIKLKSILNEATSWLTKNIFDHLNKELKRIEPAMYKNQHFRKAFSLYLHDLDSMPYSELGQKRFKHLEKAADFVERKTDALSSTNDRLNIKHIKTQMDAPVYSMIKNNKFKLK